VLGYQRFCPQLLSSDDNTGDKLLTSPSTAQRLRSVPGGVSVLCRTDIG
jgi:hypothetical protein